jgi:hypothetical protein
MKIRYYKPGGTRYTTGDFNPEGTPTGRFRPGLVRAKILTSTAMLTELGKSLYPDIPFSIALPIVRLPKYHWDVVENVPFPQPDGTIIYKSAYTKVWDVTQEEYELNLQLFEDKLREYLVTAEEMYLPRIPDVGYIWELVDESKPYPERFTPYTGARIFNGNFFRVASIDYMEWFADKCALSTNPLYTLSRMIKY